MAERERLTKRERREKRRRERREAEKAEAKQARWRRIRNVAVTIVAVAGVVAIFVLTDEEPPEQVTLTAEEAQRAAEQAGCTTREVEIQEGTHLSPDSAPPAGQLYPRRPPSSGPHFGSPLAPPGFHDDPIDERSTVHNLEHGAVAVWYDPAALDEDGRRRLEDWVRGRNRAGFNAGRGGAAIMGAPFDGRLDGSSVAFRAWGAEVDCADFDATAGDAFLAEHFGTRGRAPEGAMAPYPEEAVRVVQDPASTPTTPNG